MAGVNGELCGGVDINVVTVEFRSGGLGRDAPAFVLQQRFLEVVLERLQRFSGPLIEWFLAATSLELILAGTLVGGLVGMVIYVGVRLATTVFATGARLFITVLTIPYTTARPLLTSRYSVRAEVLYGLLALVNGSALIGLDFAANTGRPRFFGMTVIAVLAVLLLDVFLLVPGGIGGAVVARTRPLWIVIQDRRFAGSVLSLSVVVLLLVGRGTAHFLLVSAFFASVVVHIYLADYGRTSTTSTLGLLAGGGGLLLAAQVLTVPYYVRTLDTVYHTALARRITTVGSLAAVRTTRYADLPVFHTLASIGTQLSALEPRLLIALLFIVLFPVALVAGFVVFRNVTGRPKLALLGVAALAVNPEFIAWGTQAHVQSLSFVFLAVFLVLLTKWARDVRYAVAAGVVILAWIMTHHLSVFMAVILLSAPVGVGTLWVLVANRDYWSAIQRPLRQHTLLTVAVAVYWWLTGLVWVPVNWITRFSPAATTGLPTEQFLIQVYSNPVELALAAVPFVLEQFHYVFFLALAGYGLWTIVRAGGTLPSRVFPVAILGFLVAAPLYVPNPTWMVARGLAALNRWGIMTLLFVMLVPVLGLRRLRGDTGRSVSALGIALLVVVMVFVSITAGFTDPSLADTAGYEKGDRKYLTTENLAAADHVLEYTADTSVSTSHLFSGYLTHESWTSGANERPERFERMVVVDGRLVTRPGLTVIQHRALQEKQIKVSIKPPQSEPYPDDVTIFAPVSADDVELGLARENVVYDNADTIITFKPRTAEFVDNPDEP